MFRAVSQKIVCCDCSEELLYPVYGRLLYRGGFPPHDTTTQIQIYTNIFLGALLPTIQQPRFKYKHLPGGSPPHDTTTQIQIYTNVFLGVLLPTIQQLRYKYIQTSAWIFAMLRNLLRYTAPQFTLRPLESHKIQNCTQNINSYQLVPGTPTIYF